MKKLICLFVAIIVSCGAVSACEWKFAKTEESSTATTTSPTSTTSTITEPPVEELVFEHGDNFTAEDVDFVKYFHGYQDSLISPVIYSASDVFSNIKEDKGYLYFVNVNISNPYYICGFIDLNIEENLACWGRGAIDVERCVWYKFDNKDSIPTEIGKLSLGWSFQIYDATVVEDIGNKTDCKHQFKLYTLGHGSVVNFREIYEYMFIYHNKSIDNMNYLEEMPLAGRYYRGYTTTDEKSYFVLKVGNSVNEDGSVLDYLDQNKKHLEGYYAILSPHFEHIEELDDEIISADGKVVKCLYYGVSIETLTEILTGNK